MKELNLTIRDGSNELLQNIELIMRSVEGATVCLSAEKSFGLSDEDTTSFILVRAETNKCLNQDALRNATRNALEAVATFAEKQEDVVTLSCNDVPYFFSSRADAAAAYASLTI